MIKGIYYEFISFLCNYRYSMPLGILYNEEPLFYVYKTTKMAKLLSKESQNRIYLLSPYDPILFLDSLEHKIENNISYDNGCPKLDESIGIWYNCNAIYKKEFNDKLEFYCSNLLKLKGDAVPYNRSYGCIVELLVLLTKVQAGVKEPWFLTYANGLKWCVERSSNKDERYAKVSDHILQLLKKYYGES
ncbi:DUF447 domain-containing protein [Caldisphaera sp.]|uniref:DUF447 domain-containing protein n=1 Tax=Caldisphaera sp. TaxID=2060322 RepID=UPI0025C58795|nr:DUF447 domain-containing protein [Caldisphaera sp.]